MTLPRVTDGAAARPGVPPRLLALDLDGTCLDLQQRLHPRTREAVRRVAERMPVVIATGRMYPSSAAWAQEMGATAPVVCYQGAVVRELPGGNGAKGRVLAEVRLAPAPALRGLRLARAHGWHYQAYQDDVLLCEEDRPEAHLYARIAQCGITFVDDLEPVLSAGSVKTVCVVDDPEEVIRCEGALRDELGADARVVRSLHPFVEVTDPRVGKGRAVRRVCELLGVDETEVVAVGDAPNDRDLLAMAGYAVAVEGAPPEVLAEADAVCAGPGDAGVADVLEAAGLL